MNFTDPEYIRQRQIRRMKRRRRKIFWRFVGIFSMLATVLVLIYFGIIFFNPYSKLNPFPPPITRTASESTFAPTSTVTHVLAIPSATFTPFLRETATYTLQPSATESPTATLEPTLTSTPWAYTPDPNAKYSYALEGIPAPMSSILFRPQSGCTWQGIAGRVVDLQGRAVQMLQVRLQGEYGDEEIEMTTLTGGAAAIYGESGYEFYLGNKPMDTTRTLVIQLFDQDLHPLSDLIRIDTYSQCDKNLLLINFKQVR